MTNFIYPLSTIPQRFLVIVVIPLITVCFYYLWIIKRSSKVRSPLLLRETLLINLWGHGIDQILNLFEKPGQMESVCNCMVNVHRQRHN